VAVNITAVPFVIPVILLASTVPVEAVIMAPNGLLKVILYVEPSQIPAE
jgi:hypothetical protein